MTLTSQRHEFDIPEDVAYLNCAYLGPLSRPTCDVGVGAVARKARPWEITVPDFFEPLTRAREAFARLVGGDAAGVAIIPSASYGLATAAANLPVEAGQEIVVLADQFPSNVYVWRDLAARTGAVVRTVERPHDLDWTAALEEVIGERTAIVAVGNCHWTDGTLIDVARVGKAAAAVGAALVVDAAQSLGALPFDVGACSPAFVVGVAYKWLLGPYSVAFMWVAPQWRGGRPLELNWITRAGSEDFAGLVGYTDELHAGARRYDVGEPSNFALLPTAIAAMDQILEWDPAEIAAYAAGLTDRVADRADELSLAVAPRDLRSSHLLGVRVAGADAVRLAGGLREAGVHVSVRGDAIRVSAHVFNTEADVDRLFDALPPLLP